MKEAIHTLWTQAGGGRPPGELLNTPPTAQSLWSELGPLTIVLGAVLLLGLVLFFAVYLWKRAPVEDVVSAAGAHHHHPHRGKRRKRLRQHRPRNPTLAETGGLPPLRDEPPPSPPQPPPPAATSP